MNRKDVLRAIAERLVNHVGDQRFHSFIGPVHLICRAERPVFGLHGRKITVNDGELELFIWNRAIREART